MSADCRVVRDLLPVVLLEEAGPGDADRIRDHLASCAGCRTEAERVSRLLGSLAATEVPDPGPAYWDSFLARVWHRISRERASGRTALHGLRWALAASVALFILGAAAAVTLRPSADSQSRMALEFIVCTSPDTLSQALDEVLPGPESIGTVRSAGGLEVPGPVELQRALDSLVPPEEGDLDTVAEDLSPSARSWLLRTLLPDRV
jgi:hypothetical protein